MNRPYTEFKNKWLGECIDYDGAFWFQCTDLIKQYLDECLWLWKQKALGNANQIPNNLIKQKFWKIDPGKNIIQGDIIVRTSWKLWHIAIVDRVLWDKVHVLEQNWTGKNSGSWKDWNEIRIHAYDRNWFQVILRNEDILRNYNKEVEFVEERLAEIERALKITQDYREAIQYQKR